MALIATTPAEGPPPDRGGSEEIQDGDNMQGTEEGASAADHIRECTLGNRIFSSAPRSLQYYARTYCYSGYQDRIQVGIRTDCIYTVGGMDLVQYGYHADSKSCTNCYDVTVNEGLDNLPRRSSYSITSYHYVADDGDEHHGDWYNCCVHVR